MKYYTRQRDIFLKKVELFCWLTALLLSTLTNTSIASEKYEHLEKIYNSLELKAINQKKIKLAENKTPLVILNFWASWCIPCLEEIPSIVNLRSKFSTKELEIFLINTDEHDQMKNIEKIKKKFNIPETIMIVADKNFKIADQFKFSAIPVSIFYKNKKVLYFSDGPVKFDSTEMIEKITSNLKNN